MTPADKSTPGVSIIIVNWNVTIHRLIVSRVTISGRLGLKMLFAWADLLNLAYYRIWFHKVSPRLRHLTDRGPRPLWHSWIRTRL